MNPSIVSAAKLVIASDKNRALALVASAALALLSGCAADGTPVEQVETQDEVTITGEKADAPLADRMELSMGIDAMRRAARGRFSVEAESGARLGARGAVEGASCAPPMVLEGGRCYSVCPDGTVADGPVCWEPCPVTHPTACGGICTAALECPTRLPLQVVKDVIQMPR